MTSIGFDATLIRPCHPAALAPQPPRRPAPPRLPRAGAVGLVLRLAAALIPFGALSFMFLAL